MLTPHLVIIKLLLDKICHSGRGIFIRIQHIASFEIVQKFDLHHNIILYASNTDEMHARQRDQFKIHRRNFTLSRVGVFAFHLLSLIYFSMRLHSSRSENDLASENIYLFPSKDIFYKRNVCDSRVLAAT